MRPRSWLLPLSFVLAFTSMALPQPLPPPNIVVVMTDDQAAETVRVMPQLQSLWMAQGVTFTNAVVVDPLCCPGRASLLTGEYPHNHGVWDNAFPGGYTGMSYANTLPVWLQQQAGYHTAYMGKFLNGYGIYNTPHDGVPACRELPLGWNRWFGLLTPPNYNNYIINSDGQILRYGAAAVPRGCSANSSRPNSYLTDELSLQAQAYIQSRAGLPQPWLLWVAPFAPHRSSGGSTAPPPAPRHAGLFASEPFPTSAAFNELDVSDKPAFIGALPLLTQQQTTQGATVYRAQLETLQAVDDLVAAIESTLVATGQAANTVRIYTSDNGGLGQGDHRWRADKFVVYEGSIKVPLAIRGPGYSAGVARSDLVANVDIAATIATLAGVAPGRTQDGADLGPLLRGEPVSWRSALMLEARHTLSSYDAIRTSQYVYAEHLTGEQELYDLSTDPDQMDSQHANPAYAPIRSSLAAQLQVLRGCSGSGCWVP